MVKHFMYELPIAIYRSLEKFAVYQVQQITVLDLW